MASPLPPDPYLALSVAKDASASAIKTQYRKLVLKFHPDKVRDESQKSAAADEFHKVQTAYEIIGDEDRRHRYDAQVKLADLRRDAASRGGERGPGLDVKSAASKFPAESRGASTYHARGSERVSPTYEERRPAFATDDYFAQSPRTNSRKDRDDAYERSARHQPLRENHVKPKAPQKAAKESERSSRREKNIRTDKEIKRERDRKSAPAKMDIVSDTSSDEDEYASAVRRGDPDVQRRREEDQRRVKQQFWEQASRQKEEADRGNYSDERTRKMFAQHAHAFDAIRSGGKREEPVTRSTPTRPSSSKDNWKNAFDKIRQNTERPAMVRRDSQRSKTVVRDTEPQSRRSGTRGYERRASEDFITAHRKPTLNTVHSSPADIQMPTDKPRARSLQVEKDDLPPQPQMRRAETMPTRTASVRDRDVRKHKDATMPQRSSGLRQTEAVSPAASPDYAAPSPDPNTYYQYQNHQYADDAEYPTPDGYKTEMRNPAKSKKHTRSPSPMREKDRDVHDVQPETRERRNSWEARDPIRDKTRASSSRYTQPATQTRPNTGRTTSTSYVYNNGGRNVDPDSRPVPRREDSRDYLYGEVPTTRSPQAPQNSRYSPPPEPEHEPFTAQRRTRQPGDIRPQTGYGPTHRPLNPSRANSGAQRPVFAR